jgi:hypothetical protein
MVGDWRGVGGHYLVELVFPFCGSREIRKGQIGDAKIRGWPVHIVVVDCTMKTMRPNLFWAFAYNVVGISVTTPRNIRILREQ